MPENLRDDAEVLALLDEQRGVCVAEVVEAAYQGDIDGGDTGTR